MPTDLFLPQSPPSDLLPVHFDFAAAQAAITALHRAARSVDGGARRRVQDARDAERHWTGGQRQMFDRNEADVATAASGLVRDLNAAADKIAQDVRDAQAANKHRAAALAEWKQDLADARKHEIEARNAAQKGG